MNRRYEDMTEEEDACGALLMRVISLEAVAREHQAALESIISKSRQECVDAVVAGRRLLDEMEDES